MFGGPLGGVAAWNLTSPMRNIGSGLNLLAMASYRADYEFTGNINSNRKSWYHFGSAVTSWATGKQMGNVSVGAKWWSKFASNGWGVSTKEAYINIGTRYAARSTYSWIGKILFLGRQEEKK